MTTMPSAASAEKRRAKNGETLGGLRSRHHRPYNKLSCMVANYVVILPVEEHALNEESEE